MYAPAVELPYLKVKTNLIPEVAGQVSTRKLREMWPLMWTTKLDIKEQKNIAPFVVATLAMSLKMARARLPV